MTDRELVDKWKNKTFTEEEYFELRRRLPLLPHEIKEDMFRQPIADAMQHDLLLIMVAEGTTRSPLERRLTLIALVLGLAGSVSAIAQLFRDDPTVHAYPTLIRELVLHTKADLSVFGMQTFRLCPVSPETEKNE